MILQRAASGRPAHNYGRRAEPLQSAPLRANIHKPIADLHLRDKKPRGSLSKLRTFALYDRGVTLSKTTDASRFAAGIAEFAMLLRNSPHAGRSTWASAERLASGAIGLDPGGHRRAFSSSSPKP